MSYYVPFNSRTIFLLKYIETNKCLKNRLERIFKSPHNFKSNKIFFHTTQCVSISFIINAIHSIELSSKYKYSTILYWKTRLVETWIPLTHWHDNQHACTWDKLIIFLSNCMNNQTFKLSLWHIEQTVFNHRSNNQRCFVVCLSKFLQNHCVFIEFIFIICNNRFIFKSFFHSKWVKLLIL